MFLLCLFRIFLFYFSSYVDLQTEIKRVLQTVYGFEVEKVRTLNMQGKKKYRGRVLVAKPNYKKAYVTLKESSTISPTLFSVNSMGDESSKSMKKQ